MQSQNLLLSLEPSLCMKHDVSEEAIVGRSERLEVSFDFETSIRVWVLPLRHCKMVQLRVLGTVM